MDADEIQGRRPGDPLYELARQDLAPLSVTELEARIGLLEAEIERVRSHMHRAINHRASADALFRK